MLQGSQVWVKYINGKGGLNGHQVRLNVYDDGADPARHRAQVQQAIERDHAIAFLAGFQALTGEGSVDYITAKRVPVIGADSGENWMYSSPMYFPQASSGDAHFVGWITGLAEQMVPAGKTKLGLLACVEAQGCTDADRVFSQQAKALGFDFVYRTKASIAQPDFTAECLAARNAGVQVLVVLFDANADSRLATSCARQDYRPIYSFHVAVIRDSFKEDPNLDGMLTQSNFFLYFQVGTPATDEFHRAMRTYGENVLPGGGPPVGWVAGKLLEKAAAHLPEPPTSEAILRGLWSIKDDDLGGLTQPLTFVENQPTKPVACWFNIAIKNRTWISPDKFERHCRQDTIKIG